MAKSTCIRTLEKRMNRQEFALAGQMIKSSGVKNRQELAQLDPFTIRNMRAYKASLSKGIYPRGTVMARLLKLQSSRTLRMVIGAIASSADEEPTPATQSTPV